MDFISVVQARHSIRAFDDRPIDAANLHAILNCVNQAPSAGNLRAYEIYQVTSPRLRAALARAADQSFIAEAPIILVFFANPGRSARRYGNRGATLYAIQDATIAAAYAQLAAVDLGLATVWVGAFNDRAVTQALNAPGDWVPVAILPVGHPAAEAGSSTRRSLDDLVHPA